MGKKLLVSLAMEGKFAATDGLQSLEEDDDMLTAMARELVTEKGVGESADAVWKRIQAEHTQMETAAALGARGQPNVPGVEPVWPQEPSDFAFSSPPSPQRAAEQLLLFEP